MSLTAESRTSVEQPANLLVEKQINKSPNREKIFPSNPILALREKIKSSSLAELRLKCLLQLDLNLSSLLNARLILEEARRLHFDGRIFSLNDSQNKDFYLVVLDIMWPNAYSLNLPPNCEFRVREVVNNGLDVTEQIMNPPRRNSM